ncbi:surface antigen BspA-like [Trichomonas vaginalis G3]|uniref:Surface antigen BspA-like n=1 Tax=Trichomonas vaginalis (strain ATCC PRA-98 / G3) TaxID=412133 RepID=A2EPJ2_TRIV3|nr:ribonuclease inhibitor domain-containing protein [Trichomonas vaginalis G3]EAY05421.1 surface antigen BspA-like [Trichomonas vaginalis G3]KAI5523860.1 ribonuclease inhibitor domain-containing protein [Trichomonas vaginalis G3]|eukprot:XP_001317644.1 surface antigen BspA-like [Trichomonas vaginalis G3]
MSGSTIEEFIGWSSIETIGTYIFHATNSLKTIDISMTKISVIPQFCFYGCKSLTTVLLPDNLTSIMQNSFLNLAIIEKFYIPSLVTSIEDQAFSTFPLLKMIVYFGKCDFKDRNLFISCPSLTRARVIPLYPSNKFGYCHVTRDALLYGLLGIVCPSFNYGNYFSFASLFSSSFFIFLV